MQVVNILLIRCVSGTYHCILLVNPSCVRNEVFPAKQANAIYTKLVMSDICYWIGCWYRYHEWALVYEVALLTNSNSQWIAGDQKKHDVHRDKFSTSSLLQTRTLTKNVYYNDVIMRAMASQITSLKIVYSTICSGADQRKHQRSAPLVFVRRIHRWPVNSPHKRPVTRKMFPFDDVIMFGNDSTGWLTKNKTSADETI